MSLLGSGVRFCRTARAMGVVTLVGRVVVEYRTYIGSSFERILEMA